MWDHRVAGWCQEDLVNDLAWASLGTGVIDKHHVKPDRDQAAAQTAGIARTICLKQERTSIGFSRRNIALVLPKSTSGRACQDKRGGRS